MKDVKNTSEENDELRAEYDFAAMKGVRCKHYAEYTAGTNVVLLAPDVAQAFQTSQAVNEALRRLLEIEKNAA